ncbi:MAG: nucleoside triphosphate pyrophosphatase [Pseudomonadota bacterium]
MFPKVEGGPPLILASASQARAAMFEAAGIDVSLRPAAVDEGDIKASFKAAGGSAGEAAVALAELKANVIASTVPPDAIVLGADQILTCDGDWFDKPVDRNAAHAQLSKLGGKPHELHTAVVAFRGGARIWHHLATPRLQMRPLSSDFIERYLDAAGDGALASVGCYQIEGAGAHLFTRTDGDYFSILGMPLLPVLTFLRDQGVVMT